MYATPLRSHGSRKASDWPLAVLAPQCGAQYPKLGALARPLAAEIGIDGRLVALPPRSGLPRRGGSRAPSHKAGETDNPQLNKLKTLLGEPKWRQDPTAIGRAITEADAALLIEELPLLLYHQLTAAPRQALQKRLLDLADLPERRERLEARLLGLLDRGLVGFYPGSLRQADVELIVTVLHQIYGDRSLPSAIMHSALDWLTAAQIVDSLAVLTRAGFDPSFVLDEWLARPDAQMTSEQLGAFASYHEAQDRANAEAEALADEILTAGEADAAAMLDADLVIAQATTSRYTGSEVRVLAERAEFLARCRAHPNLVPDDFGEVIDDLQLQEVSDRLLVRLFSFDQQVALLAGEFCAPAAFPENPLDHACPFTLLRFWQPLHALAETGCVLNLDLDSMIRNAFKDAQPDELPAFEEFLVENAQALSRAGVNFERLRGFVGDPQRAARLNREIDAYLAERSVQPLTPTTS